MILSKKHDRSVWKPFQTRKPTDDEPQEWARRKYGIGIVGGKISGCFQALDNDDVPLWNPYVELIKLHAPDLWQRLTIIETPSDGHHIPFRCDTIEGNQPLARRPRTVEVAAGTKDTKGKGGKWYLEKFDILFETRGEGGYIVAPGSPLNVHLAGKPYRFIKGSLDTIPKLTEDERALLFNLARAFDECDPSGDKPNAKRKSTGTLWPGDDYDLRGNIEQDLLNHGWGVERRAGRVTYLRKPGKGKGHQATLHAVAPNVFWCFSTSAAPFEANKPYTPFQVYALLEHNGDFTAAAKALAQLGYGTPKATGKATSKKAATRTDEDKQIPTDDELAKRWIATQPLTAFARSNFYRYENGLWRIHPEPIAKREIKSGETITVERKFEHPYDFNPTVKLLWAMNEKPRVADPNNGIFRRVHIINIPPIDDADKDVTLKPRIQLEGPGILNWCLDGWERLTHRGYFVKPLTVVEASYDFQLSSDICALFMAECMERDPQPLAPTMRERSGDLYKSFKQWALDNGHKPLSSHRAAERWQALGLERRSIHGQKYYFGAELNETAPR